MYSTKKMQSLALATLLGLLLMSLAGCKAESVQVKVDNLPAVAVSNWRGRTVGEILAAVGVALGPDDRVSTSIDSPASPGMTIQVTHAQPVQIYAGGELYSLATTSHRPADWLEAASITLFEGDLLESPEGPIDPTDENLSRAVRVVQPARVTIDLDGHATVLQSHAATVGQAVWEAGIELLQADTITPESRAPLVDGMTIVIRKARPITIGQAGTTLTVLSAAAQVGEVLGQAGIGLQGLDYSIPGESETVPKDGHIQVVRVSEEVQVAQTPLAFEAKYQPDPETPLDGQRVIQPGEYGVEAMRVRIRYEDGVEVSRSVEETWLMTPPQNQILGYGTKIEVKTTVVDGVTLEYYRAVTMYATSYSPCRSGGTRCYPNTSSGKKVTKGVVAVLLSWYLNMQGQAVYIPGYGYATIEDVGGGIPGRHWIDLGYTDEDYVSWHQWVTVYFLTPVPANVMAILP